MSLCEGAADGSTSGGAEWRDEARMQLDADVCSAAAPQPAACREAERSRGSVAAEAPGAALAAKAALPERTSMRLRCSMAAEGMAVQQRERPRCVAGLRSSRVASRAQRLERGSATCWKKASQRREGGKWPARRRRTRRRKQAAQELGAAIW